MPATAPWQAPLANSPAAVGLKNGGLSEMTTDIIYPASRQVDSEFQSGRQQTSKAPIAYWLPSWLLSPMIVL